MDVSRDACASLQPSRLRIHVPAALQALRQSHEALPEFDSRAGPT